MSKFFSFFSSTIGKKITVALTGLFLCAFIVVHLFGNFQLFYDDAGFAFNQYTVFMTTNPVIKTISYILYFSILYHAFKGLYLANKNRRARPVKYAVVHGAANSTWSSRNMGILGTVLLIFIVVHMGNFWWGYHNGDLPYTQYTVDLKKREVTDVQDVSGQYDQETVKSALVTDVENQREIHVYRDLYKVVEFSFGQAWYVLLYVISMGALGFHLVHGFKSAFQTLGINYPRYNGLIRWVGVFIFGIIIPLGFASMPIYFFLFH